MNDRGMVTGPGTIRFERMLPGPIERAWAHLAEPDRRARWFCGGAIEPRVGGRFDLDFDHRRITDRAEATPEEYGAMAEGIHFEGRVTAWDPPRRFGYAWIEEDFGESEVTFDLAAAGDGVRLTVTHRGLGDDERVSAAAGWHAHLDILGDDLAGRPRRAFWSEHAKHEVAYASTKGFA